MEKQAIGNRVKVFGGVGTCMIKHLSMSKRWREEKDSEPTTKLFEKRGS